MNIKTTVNECFLDCLFKNEEIVDNQPPADAVIVDGIVRKYGFHAGRLADHKEEIREVLNKMPLEFFPAPEGGGGWSFLNLCMDRENNQWGEHIDMEQLVSLGVAMGLVTYLAPKEYWKVLPGGMPYVLIDTSK